MSNLSDFLGGSGGGGDPQATFQASANVANGDLVVLNDNGTVAPVELNTFSADLTTSASVNSIYGSTSTRYSNGGYFMGYNSINDQYILTVSTGNNTTILYRGSINSSGVSSFNAITSRSNVYATHLAQDYNKYNNFYFGSRNSAGNFQVEALYWNGSNYTNGSQYGVSGSQSTGSNCVYVGVNDDGTVIASSRAGANARIGMAALTPSGNGSGSMTLQYTITNTEASASDMSYAIDDGGFHGAHCGGNVHAILHRHNGDGLNLWVMPVYADASSVTYGTPAYSGLPSAGNYLDVCYDPVGNVGLILYGSGVKGFTVDKTNLTVSFFTVTTNASPTQAGGVGFNRKANLFHFLPGNNKTVETFTLSSDGTQGTVTEYALSGSSSLGNYAAEYAGIHNFQDKGSVGITFNSNTDNQQYMTTFTPSYSTTNIDSYFGEAKEAITSGSAGPIGIFNRTVSFANAGLNKGQKLFANPSGSALATSGTYRVGYATDGDTVLVTGDPS